MVKYEELYEEIKHMLSEKRFNHCEGVVRRAIEYAEIYDVDTETVKLAAIAHDIAKELTPEQEEEVIAKYNVELDDFEKENHNLFHAKLGAEICRNKYGFTDDMVNAVKYHTTGRPEMSTLEKVIYLADATDENRKYEQDYYINVIKENIDKGMVEVSKWVINHLLEKERPIHMDSINCYNYYLNKIS
ncbi:MAG: bis(5'-nucleosyl)-tetraphosphatase (symmetrical) YqeK [Clostridia bacterium]|nr:bis(5'-nucleosyl)-tetraphosphatase (symmetrical) YqeK [Clostridia bacterium]